jgi:MscS family membrane protein
MVMPRSVSENRHHPVKTPTVSLRIAGSGKTRAGLHKIVQYLKQGIRAASFLLLLHGFLPAHAQAQVPPAPKPPAAAPQDPLNRDTPQSAVFSFLEACHIKDYARAAKYLDLRKLPEDSRLEQGQQLARQLALVLDRDARFDVASLSRESNGDPDDNLPPDRDLLDSLDVNGKPVQFSLERTTLRSGVVIWLLSPESVDLIPQLTTSTSTSPIEKHLPPPLVNWTLVDTALWRWIAMALLIAVLVAFSRWISRLVLFIADAILNHTSQGLNRSVLHSFSAPLELLLPVLLFRAAIPLFGLSALLRLGLQRVLVLLLFLSLSWLFVRIVDAFIVNIHTVLIARKSGFSYSALSLASRLLKLTVLMFAIIAVLGNWGYNTSTILAGLGVGGLAIALAAQKTIENLFGGVSVITDRPVVIGDYCKFGTYAGTVEDIGLRSTRIRTIDRTLVTVPNGAFSAMTLENFNRRDKMLFHTVLNLRRDTTPDQVRAILASVGNTLKRNPKVEAGELPVRFNAIGTYSLDMEVFVYILTIDGDEFLRIQQEILLTILDEIAAAGTALALPTQANVSYSFAGGESEKDGRTTAQNWRH